MEEILWWIGQGFGVVAIALGLLTYQLKTQRGIIVAQIGVASSFVLHFAFLGAWTGMAINLVAVIRGFAYYYRNKRGSRGALIPAIFTVIMVGAGILSWTDWFSIFVLVGCSVNNVCMALSDPNKVRASILVTSPLVLVYDLFTMAIPGAVYESVAVISAAVGIVRYMQKKRNTECSEQ